MAVWVSFQRLLFAGVVFGATTSWAPSAAAQAVERPISVDAIVHQRGTAVLVRQPRDSLLIFLDSRDTPLWQRRLSVDQGASVLLRGVDADRVCRARREAVSGTFGGIPAGPYIEVECFRSTDGRPLTPLFFAESSSSSPVGPLLGTVGTQGSPVVYATTRESSAAAPELRQLQQLADGRELRRRLGSGRALVSETGEVLVVDAAQGRIRFDAAGRELASSPSIDLSAPLALASSGQSLALSRFAPQSEDRVEIGLVGLSEDLEFRWGRSMVLPRSSLFGNALRGLQGAPALGGPQDPSLPAARSTLGGPWMLALGARQIRFLDPLSGEPGPELSLPSSGSSAAPQGWAVIPTFSGVTLLRTDAEGLELRSVIPSEGRIGPPVRVPKVLGADVSSAGIALAGSRVVLAPLSVNGPLRVVRAPTLLTYALPATAQYSGLWFDPEASGQGLVLDVSARSGRWFAGWFTFADLPFTGEVPAEARRLAWYTALATTTGASTQLPVHGQLFESRGGDFLGQAQPSTQVVGQFSLRAIECNVLEFSYRLRVPGSVSESVGARRLQRLGPAPAECGGRSLPEQSGLRSASTGSWVLEGRPSQGVLMQVDPGVAGATGAVWGAWFGFDAGQADDSLAQHWLTLSGRSVTGQPGVVEIEWMRTLGGAFDAVPTRNTRRVGSGRLRFLSCDRAVLDYRFDAPGLPGDGFAGLQGQMHLRRFEPCS